MIPRATTFSTDDRVRSGANAFAEIASAKRETYALYEIAQSMGRSMSLTETMTLVSAKLSELVPFSTCALFVRRGDADLRCRFSIGLHADLLENASIAEGNGLSGWVARHRRPLVNGLPSVEFNAAGASAADFQLRSALVCPLTVADEVIGTIAVFHQDANRTRKTTAACSIRWPIRRRQSYTMRSCSSAPRNKHSKMA